MAVRVGWHSSPRHEFAFYSVPTRRVSRRTFAYINPVAMYTPADYGRILDSVFEMADAVATSNGTPPSSAVEQVLQAEGWRLLPRHKRAILKALQS